MLSIKQIQDIIYANIVDNLLKTDPDLQLQQNIEVITAFANGTAPLPKQVMEYAAMAARQGNPLTADSVRDNPELGMLEFWGLWRLGRLPYVATFGKYAITVTGTGILKRGTILTIQATNENYIIDNDADINTAGLINVTSTSKGTPAALNTNDTLQFTQAYTGIDMIATVKSVLFAPLDDEPIPEYRRKILDTLKIIPNGSSTGDYYLYAAHIDGVYKAYTYSGMFLGGAVMYIKANAANATDNHGTPAKAIIDKVKDYCIIKGGLHAKSIVYRGIVIRKYYVNLTNVDDSLKSKVNAIVKDYFDSKEPFIAGIDDMAQMDKEVISKSELFGKILIEINPAIIGNITIDVDSIAANSEITTADLTSNFAHIFGANATNEQYLNLTINQMDTEFKIITAQSANDLVAYSKILHDIMIAKGVAVSTPDNKKLVFKNIDPSSTAKLSFETKTTSSGVDLSDAGHLNLAAATTIAIGTVTKITDISNETLPQGNTTAYEIIYV